MEVIMEKRTVLVVDDNKTNLQIIKAVLEGEYTVFLALSGQTALKFVEKRKPELILLDLMMPEMDGRETFEKIRENPDNRNIPIIFLTADNSESTEASCLEIGASDFIIKPIVPQVLVQRIEKTFELEDLRHHLRKKTDEKARKMEFQAVKAIAAAVEAMEDRDEETKGHSRRTAEYSRAIAVGMAMNPEEAEQVYRSALLHDVGKIGVPDDVLKKRDGLTEEEHAQIRTHAGRGADILSAFDSMGYLSDGARYHHEHYDGTGYPEGLSGTDIPMVARIIAVADAYDGLSRKMDVSAVKEQLEKNAGTQFDPEVLKIFLRLPEEEIDRNRK